MEKQNEQLDDCVLIAFVDFFFSRKQEGKKSKPAVFVFYNPARTDRAVINKHPDE